MKPTIRRINKVTEGLKEVTDLVATYNGNRYPDLEKSNEFYVLESLYEKLKSNSENFLDILRSSIQDSTFTGEHKLFLKKIDDDEYLRRLVFSSLMNLESNYDLLTQPNYLKKEDFIYVGMFNTSHK